MTFSRAKLIKSVGKEEVPFGRWCSGVVNSRQLIPLLYNPLIYHRAERVEVGLSSIILVNDISLSGGQHCEVDRQDATTKGSSHALRIYVFLGKNVVAVKKWEASSCPVRQVIQVRQVIHVMGVLLLFGTSSKPTNPESLFAGGWLWIRSSRGTHSRIKGGVVGGGGFSTTFGGGPLFPWASFFLQIVTRQQ